MLPDRELGEKIPLSIATALPFEETITVIEGPKPNILGVNLYTLWRNFHNAFTKEDYARANKQDLYEAFKEEVLTVRTLSEQAEIPMFFYHLNYDHISKVMPNAILKDRTTKDSFRQYDVDEKRFVGRIVKDLEDENAPVAFSSSLSLPDIPRKAWILTHHPVDLLNRYRFSTLHLLESHTGAVKGPLDWLTKLTTNESYFRLPFNTLTLQLFGDGHYIDGYYDANGSKIKYRKALLAIANERRWTPATTRTKILSDLKAKKNPLLDTLASLYVNV